MNNYECKAGLRLWKNDVYILLEALRFPEQLRCYNGAVVDSVEALCIFLRRVAYPYRYGDLVSRFARPVTQLSMITNLIVSEIYDRFGHLLRTTGTMQQGSRGAMPPPPLFQIHIFQLERCMMLSSFVSVTFLQPVVMILVKNSEHRGKTFTPELVH